jgi:hypothetical protein
VRIPLIVADFADLDEMGPRVLQTSSKEYLKPLSTDEKLELARRAAQLRRDKDPFKGLPVMITRGERKGYFGTIKETLPQLGMVGVEVDVKLRVEHFKLEDVVFWYVAISIIFDMLILIQSSPAPTRDIRKPIPGQNLKLVKDVALPVLLNNPPPASLANVPSTPLPEPSSSSTPAWDPSSRTPGRVDGRLFYFCTNTYLLTKRLFDQCCLLIGC